MQTHIEYKSYNNKKSIEELQYNIQIYAESLQYLKEELHFLQFLINAHIYKPKTMNLFENLEQFKKELGKCIKKTDKFIIKINSHKNQIANIIECDELACDNYFINFHNELEENIYKFKCNILKLKSKIFNYLLSVIQTE